MMIATGSWCEKARLVEDGKMLMRVHVGRSRMGHLGRGWTTSTPAEDNENGGRFDSVPGCCRKRGLGFVVCTGFSISPLPHMSNPYNCLSLPSASFITNRARVSKATLSSFIHHRHHRPNPPSSLRCLLPPPRIISNKKWRVSCFIPQEPSSSSSSSGAEESELRRSKSLGKFSKSDVDSEEVKEKVDERWITNLKKMAVVPISMRNGIVDRILLSINWQQMESSDLMGNPGQYHGQQKLFSRGQALYSLLTDVAEGLAGIAILHRCLARFRPLPADWFRFSLRGNWQFDVWLGCLMFPLVNRLSQVNIDLLQQLSPAPVGASSVEQSIVARDPVAMALYAVVVSICAPIWEEIIFRGFLLPSLTRYMPLWSSILVSALAFALAHFNAQRLLPLVFLGVVMGTVFARSRNLLASMLLHSLWNGFVFLDLMNGCCSSNGYAEIPWRRFRIWLAWLIHVGFCIFVPPTSMGDNLRSSSS
ncbi:hypothetical protein ACLOJK_028484 [Asimina triloba]